MGKGFFFSFFRKNIFKISYDRLSLFRNFAYNNEVQCIMYTKNILGDL